MVKWGGVLSNVSVDEPNYFVSHIIESICIIGPNVFVAISAYFMVNTAKIKIRKIVDLYGQMVFWALLFYAITVVFCINVFSIKETVLVFVPFFGGRRWFVETYILLMIFAPFINILISKLDKRSYLTLIIMWLIIFSIWPSLLPSAPSTDSGYGLANFITIYLIVGYIRLYVDLNAIRKKRTAVLMVWVIATICVALMSVCPGIFGGDSIFAKICGRQWNYDFTLNIFSSISLFLLFLSVQIKPSRVINYIAGTTFGVFLIHSDFSLWKVLYQDILHCDAAYHSTLLVPHLIVSVVIMFFCSAFLEIMRRKIWISIIDKWFEHKKLLNTVIEVKTNEGCL